MPLPTTLPAAILQTILIRLAALFLLGANGDPAVAQQAAAEMLEAYAPKTPNELRVAANIIAFSFQALEALSQAATPDMPLSRILRLRGNAVSLSRESAKNERRLSQLQNAPAHAIPDDHPKSAPNIDKAVAFLLDTARTSSAAKAGNLTWTQAHQQRRRDMRLAASAQRALDRSPQNATAAPLALPEPQHRLLAQATG